MMPSRGRDCHMTWECLKWFSAILAGKGNFYTKGREWFDNSFHWLELGRYSPLFVLKNYSMEFSPCLRQVYLIISYGIESSQQQDVLRLGDYIKSAVSENKLGKQES